MTQQYDNTNTGAIFSNKKKNVNDPNDKKPNYTGKINVEGKEYYISSWIKTSKKGETFMSLSLTDPATVQRPSGGAPQ